ncbi:antibiotic biosynthesis monooxygenase [Clostridiaceae bacterium 35-E11]
MDRSICTEIAEFQVISAISDEAFIRIVEDLEENFHSKQGGFIDSELVRGNEHSQWLIIQHWDSAEQAKAASKRMMKEPITGKFRESLDPKTVKIRYLSNVLNWGR